MRMQKEGILIYSDPISPLQKFSNSPTECFDFFLNDSGVILVMEMVLIGGLNHMTIPHIPFFGVDKKRVVFSVHTGTLSYPGKLTIESQVYELSKREPEENKCIGNLCYQMENGGPCGIRLSSKSLQTTGKVHFLHPQIESNLGNTKLLIDITNKSGYAQRKVRDIQMEIVSKSRHSLLHVQLS